MIITVLITASITVFITVFSRWSCCRQSELSAGCTDICDNEKCGEVWGSGNPCVHISPLDVNAQRDIRGNEGYEVFTKEHDLVSDDSDDY